MVIKYKKVNGLEDIARDASDSIPEDCFKINFLLAYELPTRSLVKNILSDVHEKALQWSADKCPENLYFNHGQFKVGGVDNIISELKEKPSSNRALYSLIDQNTIMNSEDKPIPSFMLFQSILDEGILYCNVYFRALEVSKFLRINLEEIRLNIESIDSSSLSFHTVRLVLLACRAHHAPNFNALEKPKLEQISPVRICLMLQKNSRDIAPLIVQMAEVQTVLSSKSITHILEYVEAEWAADNKGRLIALLRRTITEIDQLEELRKQHSHHERVSTLGASVAVNLRAIAGEFDK
ncbi:hypothetical protein CXF78_07020 [Shewanella sp. 11B5]|uniref:hypothetical protein n=1 Tax=Shewanella sp. 11B5 TaxID=2058298 RepID=UPI000C7A80FC|nr:hypothetical protein [Shewanella sp. 11B5]PKI07123.1 hypothetical protein CXF78_07020 [Shewanella sp. 11B5]